MAVRWRRLVPALLSAMVLPGLGQLYLRRYKRGAVWAGLSVAVVCIVVWRMAQAASMVPVTEPSLSAYMEQVLQETIAASRGAIREVLPFALPIWAANMVDVITLVRGDAGQ